MSVYQRVFLDLDGPQVPLSREDLIHQHVLYVLRKNPDVARSRIIPVAIHTAILVHWGIVGGIVTRYINISVGFCRNI